MFPQRVRPDATKLPGDQASFKVIVLSAIVGHCLPPTESDAETNDNDRRNHHELLNTFASVMPHCPKSGGTCCNDRKHEPTAQDASKNLTGRCVVCGKLFNLKGREQSIRGRSVWLVFSFSRLRDLMAGGFDGGGMQ
ncbi:hypothetical protein Fuma_02492 [Fuerstiella marisgermanici]|uniref:Uncharacterized protein n=1 Tax=Fuerstiella marisgermanici TaxID=1891926 RepID=A0A1P8WFQ8_9PLAN|nr:hypothetical protein Fuma_02492 [Fuerstiella marisgermanici]